VSGSMGTGTHSTCGLCAATATATATAATLPCVGPPRICSRPAGHPEAGQKQGSRREALAAQMFCDVLPRCSGQQGVEITQRKLQHKYLQQQPPSAAATTKMMPQTTTAN